MKLAAGSWQLAEAGASTALVSVIGVLGEQVAPGGLERLEGAALVAGGERQLERHAPAGTERVRIGGEIAPLLDRVAGAPGPVAVLASGDPGFFGIVRALAERFGRERLEVLPAPSSVAVAFARAGIPWEDALVVSAHGRTPGAAVAAAMAHPKVAVLTAPGFPPARLGDALAGTDRRMLVAERLGSPQERIVEGTPEQIAGWDFADPNVVVVLDPARAVGPKGIAWPPLSATGWALPDEAFEHRGAMITKAEVRALALARLGPRTGRLVWDVGAGCGSVAIECARLGAAAVAVERDPDQVRRLRLNAAAHAVPVQVEAGEAPAALAALPEPDAVFVGGGGDRLPDILAAACARGPAAVVVALATLERVVPTADALQSAGLATETVMLQAARVTGLAGLSRLAGGNPTFVVSGVRR
jgi:precorrin-6B C5,15-methyltransferase / cobalt-precorrin-6B C5,C15-methyltransferase